MWLVLTARGVLCDTPFHGHPDSGQGKPLSASTWFTADASLQRGQERAALPRVWTGQRDTSDREHCSRLPLGRSSISDGQDGCGGRHSRLLPPLSENLLCKERWRESDKPILCTEAAVEWAGPGCVFCSFFSPFLCSFDPFGKYLLSYHISSPECQPWFIYFLDFHFICMIFSVCFFNTFFTVLSISCMCVYLEPIIFYLSWGMNLLCSLYQVIQMCSY